jgi:hypothetical protein
VPFTFAHPAAMLPLARGRLVAGALVAGTLAPDVPYYLPLPSWPGTTAGAETHTVLGLVTLDLVIGVILYAAWRWAVRPAALTLLPEPWRRAADDQTEAQPDLRRVSGWAAVAVSVVVGAVTHLLLDSLTHEYGPGGMIAASVNAGGYRWWWLQVAFSVIGLALLAWWLWRWAGSVAPVRGLRPAASAWWSVAVVAASTLAGAVTRLARDDPALPAYDRFTSALVGAVIGAEIAVAALVALWWWRQRRRRPSVVPAQRGDS